MKDLLRALFMDHKFELTELDFGDLYVPRDDKKYYWLIVEENDLSMVLQQQDEWFDKCKEKIDVKEFDKNTSLLISVDTDGIDLKKQEILLIEEDPYQFKKYVLLHTVDSVQSLKEHSENGDSKKILDLIINEQVFKDYKSNYGQYNWRHLLYNIAHKLPFLELSIQINQSLADLFSVANESLTKSGLLDYGQFIDKQIEDQKFSDIENLGVDEMIALLNYDTDNGN